MASDVKITELALYADRVASAAKGAARALAVATGEHKDRWLRLAAKRLRERATDVLTANARDVAAAPEHGLTAAEIDRLRLDGPRIEAMAAALEQIAMLPDPVGEVIEGHVRPNGLEIHRVRVPLGVVFFIYESRPNVTTDAAAICVKSGNAVILRGGKESLHSNLALHALLRDTLVEAELPPDAVQIVETTDRAAVGHFLRLHEKISVTIPRGGKSLIERVMAEATMPVIKHYDGNCHVYVDRAADLAMAQSILINAKCQRPGVCNAAESLLVHRDVAEAFLTSVGPDLRQRGVELRCCEQSRKLLPGSRPATDDDFRTEFLDLILSVKIVDDLEQAIAHVEEYGSHHTDVIVTNDLTAARRFVAGVDSAAVMVNASTRFNDGGEFGLGAEIGISTDKFHARGPCGLRELTSYKYVVYGNGQVRS
ncbi:MAG: glutamate-5-semialdehyde dehydrogenase [Planctomycetales bacterium]|nr:glutamate-5-semialdehyde dehydrogenase [Planctomycetales bacterium]